jgi:hypothetical protein
MSYYKRDKFLYNFVTAHSQRITKMARESSRKTALDPPSTKEFLFTIHGFRQKAPAKIFG